MHFTWIYQFGNCVGNFVFSLFENKCSTSITGFTLFTNLMLKNEKNKEWSCFFVAWNTIFPHFSLTGFRLKVSLGFRCIRAKHSKCQNVKISREFFFKCVFSANPQFFISFLFAFVLFVVLQWKTPKKKEKIKPGWWMQF